MPNLTLAISEEVRRKMAKYPEINWSEVARQAIVQKTLLLEKAESLLAKSQLTEEDAVRMGGEAKSKAWKRQARH